MRFNLFHDVHSFSMHHAHISLHYMMYPCRLELGEFTAMASVLEVRNTWDVDDLYRMDQL